MSFAAIQTFVGTADEVAERKPEMGSEEGGGRTASEASSSPSTAPNFPQNELNQSGENVLQLLPTPFFCHFQGRMNTHNQ